MESVLKLILTRWPLLRSSMKNYYKILGIDKKASKQQINAAFKRLSLQYHPDRHNGDETFDELFKENSVNGFAILHFVHSFII